MSPEFLVYVYLLIYIVCNIYFFKKVFYVYQIQVFLIYGLITAITTTFTVLCATIQRRHLMVTFFLCTITFLFASSLLVWIRKHRWPSTPYIQIHLWGSNWRFKPVCTIQLKIQTSLYTFQVVHFSPKWQSTQ